MPSKQVCCIRRAPTEKLLAVVAVLMTLFFTKERVPNSVSHLEAQTSGQASGQARGQKYHKEGRKLRINVAELKGGV